MGHITPDAVKKRLEDSYVGQDLRSFCSELMDGRDIVIPATCSACTEHFDTLNVTPGRSESVELKAESGIK